VEAGILIEVGRVGDEDLHGDVLADGYCLMTASNSNVCVGGMPLAEQMPPP
jgi:hypothetical protein